MNRILKIFFLFLFVICASKIQAGNGTGTKPGPGGNNDNLNWSVFDEARARIHKNPIIKFYTEPKGQGKLVATVNGDKFGNFFTTENIDFTRNGLYPVLIGSPTAAESIKYMQTPIFKGDCNSCHGPRAEALGID